MLSIEIEKKGGGTVFVREMVNLILDTSLKRWAKVTWNVRPKLRREASYENIGILPFLVFFCTRVPVTDLIAKNKGFLPQFCWEAV